ncbi:hypothetical protein M5M_02555 [Simiduia agarivorans SA1 = DSM 21679]|uniref:Uncharacterized protein n=1 Tax=Simiduia agarivorans (strain DSM 21679 / JCM 13881 / BCRC 17597 / SA1) TaxID=1117647 RepID=K4KHS6_SIMAS|nr:hypothetical protein M5M_02555 [Simiduia agarivorans SA1 = DSM 21679]
MRLPNNEDTGIRGCYGFAAYRIASDTGQLKIKRQLLISGKAAGRRRLENTFGEAKVGSAFVD